MVTKTKKRIAAKKAVKAHKHPAPPAPTSTFTEKDRNVFQTLIRDINRLDVRIAELSKEASAQATTLRGELRDLAVSMHDKLEKKMDRIAGDA